MHRGVARKAKQTEGWEYSTHGPPTPPSSELGRSADQDQRRTTTKQIQQKYNKAELERKARKVDKYDQCWHIKVTLKGYKDCQIVLIYFYFFLSKVNLRFDVIFVSTSLLLKNML